MELLDPIAWTVHDPRDLVRHRPARRRSRQIREAHHLHVLSSTPLGNPFEVSRGPQVGKRVVRDVPRFPNQIVAHRQIGLAWPLPPLDAAAAVWTAVASEIGPECRL